MFTSEAEIFKLKTIKLLNKMKCAVKDCKSSNSNNSKQLHFYCFPSNDCDRKQWISFCCRGKIINVKNARICMEHFRPEDFDNKLEFEMGK